MGKNCFAHFRGMFGIAIWVQSERRLVLARDPHGHQAAVLITHADGELYFGSELKCDLCCILRSPRNLCMPG